MKKSIRRFLTLLLSVAMMLGCVGVSAFAEEEELLPIIEEETPVQQEDKPVVVPDAPEEETPPPADPEPAADPAEEPEKKPVEAPAETFTGSVAAVLQNEGGVFEGDTLVYLAKVTGNAALVTIRWQAEVEDEETHEKVWEDLAAGERFTITASEESFARIIRVALFDAKGEAVAAAPVVFPEIMAVEESSEDAEAPEDEESSEVRELAEDESLSEDKESAEVEESAEAGAPAQVEAAYNDGEITTWAELQTAFNADGEITLTQDIIAGAGDSALTVPKNVTVTLNLNGCTLSRGLTTPTSDGGVIVVKGTLVVTGEGTITGGNTTGQGGGVYLNNGGKFTMNGGTITGNTSAGNGAGVFVVNSTAFTVNGNATVSGNTYSNDDDGSKTQNVYLGSGAYIHVGDSFTGSVGVWTKEATYIRVTETNRCMDDGFLSHFSSDRHKEYEGRTYGLGILDGEVYFGPLFDVTVTSDSLNGTVTADRQKVMLGSNVTLTFEPADRLSALSINGNPIELSDIVNGVYTCEDVQADVTVNVTFVHFSWTDLQNALNTGGTVTLTQDYTAASGDSALTVPFGKNVTLDLNGYMLNRGLANSAAVEDGYVILNEGTLTITDSGSGGKITGGNNTGDGGGICNTGTLTLSGGKITGNTAGASGGGILNSGTLTITGGGITGNTATGWHGGGVYNSGTMNLSGGSITGNQAQGGQGSGQGGGVLNNGTLNVSGAPVVSGNTGPNGKNIYLRSVHPAMTVNGALTAGASLYVTSANEADTITSGYSTYNDTADPSQYFHADSTNHFITLANGEARIVPNGSAIVTYVERSWNGSSVVCEDKIVDARAVPSDGNMTSGWYILDSNVTKNGRIESITGDVNLILGDGYTLDVKGLYVPAGKTLTIYGQTEGTGKIDSHPGGGAGLGGYDGHDNGNIVIHGGTINATGYDNCAGIGSNSNQATGNITIYGGTVTASSRNNGAGIGAGRNSDGGTITIYGGTVTATGADSSAGIGGGDASGSYADSTTINIYGGTITATGDDKGAGLGGGEYGHATITISGGTITATGGDEGGAGIGDGAGGTGSTISLGYTDATKDTVSITASSYNGTVTLAQPFAMHSYDRVFFAGTVVDNSLLGGGALTYWKGDVSSWQLLQMAIEGASGKTTITLSDDCFASTATDTALLVPSGKNIVIDLKGHTVDRSLTGRDPAAEGYVLKNEGTLTITDSAGGGTITGGNCQGDAGGIYNTGTLTLSGGSITGNAATLSGGGVNNGGTLTVNGGTITDNTATGYHGGGIYNSGTLNLKGGSVTENTAGQQGGGILNNGTMNVSGAPVVSDNTAVSGSNIYLRAEHPTMAVSGALTEGASLYVTTAGGTGTITSGYGAKNGTTYPGAYFHADNTDYVIALADGEVQIATPFTVSIAAEAEGRLTVDKTVVPQGDTVTITIADENADIGRLCILGDGRELTGVEQGDGVTATFIMPGADVVVGFNDPVTYIQYSWSGSSLSQEEKTTDNYTVVTSERMQDYADGLTSGDYVVKADMTIEDYAFVKKGCTVNLIVLEGATLTCRKGLGCGYNKSGQYATLNIFGSGTIVATGKEKAAGIGGNDDEANGNITIHGATVTATGGKHGAGIGGGEGGKDPDGTTSITIYAGTITATGGIDGAGIGGGDEQPGAHTYIYGGTITASSEKHGAGIGGGDEEGTLGIFICGGTVTATGGEGGAGIGAGEHGGNMRKWESGGGINISGGTVTAKGGYHGAGIGGGYFENMSGTIRITGSPESVTATGGTGAAGIGAGDGAEDDSVVTFKGDMKGTIIIDCSGSGLIKIKGGGLAAGIGAGMCGNMDGKVYIRNGNIEVAEVFCGAGIGGGFELDSSGAGGEGGDVYIGGGTLKIVSCEYSDAQAIGYGMQNNIFGTDPTGSVYIDSTKNQTGRYMRVAYSKDKGKTYTTAEANKRSSKCHQDDCILYITVCNHCDYDGNSGLTYSNITADSHTKKCKYCGYEGTESHTFVNGVCTGCGYQYNGPLSTVSFGAGGGSGTMVDDHVVPGSEYILPENGFTAPEGKTFAGWSVGGATKQPGDTIIVDADVTVTALWETPQAITINGVSGSFNDKIKLNYYFDIPDSVLADEDAYVTLTNEYTGKVITLLIKEVEYIAGKGYKFSIPLAAKEAGDTITAKVYDGQGNVLTVVGASGTDYIETGVQRTLMEYCTWLESNGTENEKAVGKAAKDYCTAAQIYFNYNADGLSVSSAVTDLSADALNTYIAGRDGTLPKGVSVAGITAMLESDNTLRLYLKFKKVDPSSLTFRIDGERADLQQRSDGMYYLALDTGVWSNHLQDAHAYTVSDGTNTFTITASVLTYARASVVNGGETDVNLGKALYLYNQAAVAAFGE